MGGGQAHQDVDAELVDFAAGAEKGGAQLRVAQARAERFESGNGGFGVACRTFEITGLPEVPQSAGPLKEGRGLVDAIAGGTQTEEGLLEEWQGLRSLTDGNQGLSLVSQGGRLAGAVSGLAL